MTPTSAAAADAGSTARIPRRDPRGPVQIPLTAPGPGRGPHVRVFDGRTVAVVREFPATADGRLTWRRMARGTTRTAAGGLAGARREDAVDQTRFIALADELCGLDIPADVPGVIVRLWKRGNPQDPDELERIMRRE